MRRIFGVRISTGNSTVIMKVATACDICTFGKKHPVYMMLLLFRRAGKQNVDIGRKRQCDAKKTIVCIELVFSRLLQSRQDNPLKKDRIIWCVAQKKLLTLPWERKNAKRKLQEQDFTPTI